MNDFSFSLLVLFGLLMGFVFKDMLKAFGADKDVSDSYVSFLLLPFIAIVSFVFARFFLFSQLNFNDVQNIGSFSSSPIFWAAIASLVSGAARFVLDKTVFAKK